MGIAVGWGVGGMGMGMGMGRYGNAALPDRYRFLSARMHERLGT